MSLQEFYILSGHHCGCNSEVIDVAVHALSCLKCEGHHHRHASVNDIIHRAMSAAWIPSRLEPSGLSVLMGKDMTGLPWYSGSVVSSLPGTCSDTYAPSYSAIAATYAGGVANQAEVKKCVKYVHLDHNHNSHRVFWVRGFKISQGAWPSN